MRIFIVIITSLIIFILGGQISLESQEAAKICPVEYVTWNKDAGLVTPYAMRLESSSATALLPNLQDQNQATFWQSEAPLPYAFIQREDLNILYKKGQKIANSPHISHFTALTDGDLNTAIDVKNTSGKHWLSLNFKNRKGIQFLFIKCGNSQAIEVVTPDKGQSTTSIGQYNSQDSYTWKRFDLKKEKHESLILRSDAPFQVFEMAALAELPTEYVIADFGKPQNIGTIYSKHYAGEEMATKTTFYTSLDKKNWQPIAELAADIKHLIINPVQPNQMARYLKVEQTLVPKDWNKVFLWELAVYDEHGHYGPMPPGAVSQVTVGELLGVNSTWGWGHNKYSDLLKTGEGPELYAPISSHARNYHDLKWDISAPTEVPDYEKMAQGKGTQVHWWLNWGQEYRAWTNTKMNVQATLQIHHFKDTDWKNPYQNAFDIGVNFAKHFGTKQGNGLVCTMEAGNEPWTYAAPTYQQILLGMAKGAKLTDPNLEVFPCALQAADPSMEQTDVFKNYMGARIPAEAVPYLDGINIHCYSYLQSLLGRRIAVAPEHPQSSFREINNAIRFRNENLPGKKIYLSEWGWDADGGGEDCRHSECVSEQAATAYAIRGLMMALRLGIDRASWFFFANEQRPSSLYTRSGLTGSIDTNFKKKRIFNAFENLLHLVGDKYFIKILREDESIWAYLLGDEKGKVTHLIAWSPIDGDDRKKKSFGWPTDLQIQNVFIIDGHHIHEKRLEVSSTENRALVFEVGAMPIVVELKDKS